MPATEPATRGGASPSRRWTRWVTTTWYVAAGRPAATSSQARTSERSPWRIRSIRARHWASWSAGGVGGSIGMGVDSLMQTAYRPFKPGPQPAPHNYVGPYGSQTGHEGGVVHRLVHYAERLVMPQHLSRHHGRNRHSWQEIVGFMRGRFVMVGLRQTRAAGGAVMSQSTDELTRSELRASAATTAGASTSPFSFRRWSPSPLAGCCSKTTTPTRVSRPRRRASNHRQRPDHQGGRVQELRGRPPTSQHHAGY
jgi:hypothetical protein